MFGDGWDCSKKLRRRTWKLSRPYQQGCNESSPRKVCSIAYRSLGVASTRGARSCHRRERRSAFWRVPDITESAFSALGVAPRSSHVRKTRSASSLLDLLDSGSFDMPSQSSTRSNSRQASPDADYDPTFRNLHRLQRSSRPGQIAESSRSRSASPGLFSRIGLVAPTLEVSLAEV